MTKLEEARLKDFKKVLTYHLATKIRHHFKGDYKLYYKAPSIWAAWRDHNCKYNRLIYKCIISFNQTALSKHQCMHIFGKQDGAYINYAKLIEADNEIRTFNKGTIVVDGRRFGIKIRYQLPFELISSIFENPKLLEKVLDASSDYYTPRQRRLIFTQINKQKNYHYKTKQEIAEAISEEARIEEVLRDFDMEA